MAVNTMVPTVDQILSEHLLTDRLLTGRPYPLGATWDGLGVNFAVFSRTPRASNFVCSIHRGGEK